jgi:hypothetical protein
MLLLDRSKNGSRKTGYFSLSDIRPSETELVRAYRVQPSVKIVKILLKYASTLKEYEKDPKLQSTPRRKLPFGQKTLFSPLRVTMIEEVSM